MKYHALNFSLIFTLILALPATGQPPLSEQWDDNVFHLNSPGVLAGRDTLDARLKSYKEQIREIFGDSSLYAVALQGSAFAYYQIGDMLAFQDHLEQAMLIYKRDNQLAAYANALHTYAANCNCGFEEKKRMFDQVLTIFTKKDYELEYYKVKTSVALLESMQTFNTNLDSIVLLTREVQTYWELNNIKGPSYMISLVASGQLYERKNKWKEAIDLYQKARALVEDRTNRKGNQYNILSISIGHAQLADGQRENAIATFRQAENDLLALDSSDNNSNYLLAHTRVYLLHLSTDNSKIRVDYQRKIAQWLFTYVEDMSRFLSEEDNIKETTNLNYVTSLLSREYLQTNQIEPIYRLNLALKNFSLENSMSLLRSLDQQSDRSLVKTISEMKSLKHELEGNRPGVDNSALRQQSNEKERELLRSSAPLLKAFKIPTFQQIRSRLLPNEAAIEFIAVQTPDPETPFRFQDSTFYMAVVIRPGFLEPKLVHLFEQREFESLLTRKASDKSEENFVNSLYQQPVSIANDRVVSGKGRSVYNLIWEPIDSLLIGVREIYYSPTGLLTKIAFSAIPYPGRNVLMNRYRLIYLSSTKELTKIKRPYKLQSKQAAEIFGGINYSPIDLSKLTSTKTQDKFRSFQMEASSVRSIDFSFLQGTEMEALSVAQILKNSRIKVEMYQGKNATEETLKKNVDEVSPEILHLGTHSFFFPPPEKGQGQPSSGEFFRRAENPLLRSGLAMAGANGRWLNEAHPVDGEDGILSALEVSNLNLRKTRLVVLSACETGLGEIKGTEGVFGLQRAFKLAGAQYVLMSLWRVNDKETAWMMTFFYQNLAKGEFVESAFINAQKKMQQLHFKPYYWAGFVLVR